MTLKLIFLGTNGWYNTETGNSICTLIESPKCHIILDAGDGLHKIDRFVNDIKPIYLFLSHFHLDHISGFHILPKFRFPQGIRICGQKALKKTMGNILKPPYSLDLKKYPYPLEFIELKKEHDFLDFSVQTLALTHSTPSIGFRFTIDNRILSYCLDTGFCRNAVKLSKNADLIIAECSLIEENPDKIWPHLTPENAAIIARKAKAHKLVLTHFNPTLFPSISDRKAALNKARLIFKNSILATDNLSLNLP